MGTATRLRVLLAEDDPDFRALVSSELHRRGYDVEAVRDGRVLGDVLAGFVIGRYSQPDVILSDIRMPGSSGLDMLRAMQEAELGTPIVLMTAFGDPETHAEALRGHAAAVLDKPLDFDELDHVLRGAAGG